MSAQAPKKILAVFGTRPEAIKMAPVIKALEADPGRFTVITCVTGQHREMLDEMLRTFEIRPQIDLGLMRPNQTLPDLTARAILQLSDVLAWTTPDFTLVQGDTTTAMTAALASFYARIPVGHVEAGLRTSDRFKSVPEERNPRINGNLADLHFAPTRSAARALLSEGVAANDVFVTGNTVIDALLMTAALVPHATTRRFPNREKYILVTAHRRESFGEPIHRICEALRWVAGRHPQVGIVFPVHPNPKIRGPVYEILRHVEGVQLVEPLSYSELVACLRGAHFVVTDSGGIQEEAPSLGKPVLVVRETTERPEAVDAGVARLVGTEVKTIVAAVDELLTVPEVYARMARGTKVFGDGRASARIVRAMVARLFDDPCDRGEVEVAA